MLLVVAATLALGMAQQAPKSSYAVLLEEDALDLSQRHRNAASFIRSLEERGHRRLTQKEVRAVFAKRIEKMREMEKAPTTEQISVIRSWVKQVGPVLEDGSTTPSVGPLHLVLQRACEILDLECDDKTHPHMTARQITPAIRDFTQAIVYAYKRQGYAPEKDEL